MTGLSQEIRAATVGGRGRKNRIVLLLSALDESDRSDLLTALADRSIPAVAIVRALAARGHTVTHTMISNYRKAMTDAAR